MHHVLYEWSELIELDKHCQHLEDAINDINSLRTHLHLTDNLQQQTKNNLQQLSNDLDQELQQILLQFDHKWHHQTITN